MTLRIGSKLGRFEITGVLGEGAMGTVYLAHDRLLAVAILIAIWRRTRPPAEENAVPPAPVPAAATAAPAPRAAPPEPRTAAPAPAIAAAPEPVATAAPLPTRGPREAGDSSVGPTPTGTWRK